MKKIHVIYSKFSFDIPTLYFEVRKGGVTPLTSSIMTKGLKSLTISKLHTISVVIVRFIPPHSEQFSKKQEGIFLAFFKFPIEKKKVFQRNLQEKFYVSRKTRRVNLMIFPDLA